MKAHLAMTARYSSWANARLWAACAALPADARTQELGAAFGSVHGTLNHIIVGNEIWLARFEGRPPPGLALSDRPCADMAALTAARIRLDAAWITVAEGLSPAEIAGNFTFRNMAGAASTLPRASVLAHVFNHQTHHRGQIHALLTRLTGEAPALDMIYFLREPA